MRNEIKVGDWTITPQAIERLNDCWSSGEWLLTRLEMDAQLCVDILGVADDPIAKDYAEEIVLHGVPVDEAIAKIRRHLEAGR